MVSKHVHADSIVCRHGLARVVERLAELGRRERERRQHVQPAREGQQADDHAHEAEQANVS